MRERLFYNVTEENKKTILEALKNEQTYTKQIPVYDKDGDFLCKITKWDVYSNYIDFTLNNFISDTASKKAGAIDTIELYEFESKKGLKLRVKRIST